MRVAIIHYWLVAMRGGERVLEELCTLFPSADIYTHVFDPHAISEKIKSHRIDTTFIANLPGSRRFYRQYLPLMPVALENLDLRGYDLVISSESGPAKGVITNPDTMHICYCHSPMRYLWNMYHDYRGEVRGLARVAMPFFFNRLRQWDYLSAVRVDDFVANSNAVADRIRKYYRREATVIHPPVDVSLFSPATEIGDFYLMCGQLVGYKRADQAIEAFNQMAKKLVIIGTGPEEKHLRRIAGPTIQMLGSQPLKVLKDYYSRCRALIFPGEEDFGIVPVEVMASGRPVIAFDLGGIKDTVIDCETGVLYKPQTVQGLISAVARFEGIQSQFSTRQIINRASQFRSQLFRQKFSEHVAQTLAAHRLSKTISSIDSSVV
jgi:glycosyltransferase involved in cell wall biosynthesis